MDGVDDAYGLEARVRRFALAAGAETPTVAIVETDEATSFTADSGTAATVVVTRGLLEALSESELDAVLAHEVAHLANRDTILATVVATIGSVSEGLFARERRLGEWIRFLLAMGSVTLVFLLVAVPVVVLSICYLLVSVLARLVLAVNAICIGLHAQAREYAADRAGAELVGDPTALAAALETLEEATPCEDARSRHATATLGIVSRRLSTDHGRSPPIESSIARWVPAGDSELKGAQIVSGLSRVFGRLGRALEWRPATHPPTEKRIERLLEMADETE
ncbi:M48 family metallopeptidase [Natronorubrum sp. DTA7]|uniref:M48 family metallopeptidase n=1 Tax=Natronorubrum sp. DTA7 TaxID=3447016 RepID=UPI003F87B5CE